MIIFSTLFLSMFITLSLIPIFMRYAVRMDFMDEPCTRKVHCAPVPKVGGIAMALGALLPVALAATVDRSLGAILLGAGIIVVFGAVDDLRELGYRAKFIAQLAAALVVIYWGGVKICCLGGLAPDGFLLPDWLAVPLTLVVIIGVTNAVNLSDGLDGLAGGIMLMSFMCIGFIAYRNGNALIALLSVATIGAIFGFLRFNTYPATVFMGDAGSQLLGFLAITLATTITQGSTPVSPLLPLLLLGMPILDTLTVMAERIGNGKSPFLADKNHLHHKLLRLGLFHTESVFTLYLLQAGLVTTAFFLRFHSEWLLLAIYLGFATSLAGFLWVAARKEWRLERPGLLDWSVKNRLKFLKDRQVVIKASQSMMETLFPLLLIVTCVLPGGIPVYMSAAAAGLVLAVALVWLFKPPIVDTTLRVVVYFFLPLVIYYAELQPADWIRPGMMRLYHLSFGVLVFFAVITLKSTRRQAGFKLSPLDFIILFVAVLVPNLPDPAIRHFHLGLLAVKIIVIFFVFEVLIGELRGQLKRLGGGILIALAVLAVNGFLS